MTATQELLLLVLLLLLAASMAGAFARLLRLPAVPVQVAFGVLLAHGPSAVVDARAALLLQPVASVALWVIALGIGLRLSAPGPAFVPERTPVARHVLAEVVLVPALVWLALALLAGVPGQVALLVGLMALGSVPDTLAALARRGTAPRLAGALAAVANADLATSLALSAGAVLALRLRFDPAGLAHGWQLPAALCALALGVSLGRSAPGLASRVAGPTGRATRFALAVAGALAGASLAPALLPRALFIASLAVLARLLGKLAATAWSHQPAVPARVRRFAGLGLAPGGLVGVALLLVVRHEPSLADFADMFLAVGVWIAVLNATIGPTLARAALRAAATALSPREPPGAPRDTPPSR